MKGSGIFLDTTIQIARFFYAKQTKERIADRLKKYDMRMTTLVVRQEFKRRILGEAKYLLSLLKRLKSFHEVRRWMAILPVQWNRKRNICIDLLDTIGEPQGLRENDGDKTARAVRLLEGLVEYGPDYFDDSVDHIFEDSGCACARKENPFQSVRFASRKPFGGLCERHSQFHSKQKEHKALQG
jgi:hypothetical protein